MEKRRRGSPNLEGSLRRTLELLEKMKMEEWSLEMEELGSNGGGRWLSQKREKESEI